MDMNIVLTQHTLLSRYEGEYPSLSAFFMTPAPTVADTERVLTRGHGRLEQEGDELLLDYTEEHGEEGSIHATLRYVPKDGVTVRRGGGEMRLAVRRRTRFLYRVGLGSLDTEAYTESIEYVRRGKAGLLCVVYYALIGGVVTRTELRFKITEV